MASFLCTNICQVPVFPISDILFTKKYPEMGSGYYRIVSNLLSGYCTGRGNKCRKSLFLLTFRFLQQMQIPLLNTSA